MPKNHSATPEQAEAWAQGYRMGRTAYDAVMDNEDVRVIESTRDRAELKLPFHLRGWHSEGFDTGYETRMQEEDDTQ